MLLTASIASVFVQFLLPVLPGDLPLGHDLGEGKPADASELRRLPERKETSGVQRRSELLTDPFLRLCLRDAEAPGEWCGYV